MGAKLLHLVVPAPCLQSRCIAVIMGKEQKELAEELEGFLLLLMVLQAYQAKPLKDLDQGERLSTLEFTELCTATDLALRTTKQALSAA